MTSIEALYERSDVSKNQREKFWEKVSQIMFSSSDKKIRALESLNYMWIRYDHGGISVGRSLRSLLLDQLIDDLRSDKVEHAKKVISVLIAMYHDHEYIEKSDWYDFRLNFGLYGSSMEERVHLSVVALSLEAENEIPDISDFTKKDFFSLLQN